MTKKNGAKEVVDDEDVHIMSLRTAGPLSRRAQAAAGKVPLTVWIRDLIELGCLASEEGGRLQAVKGSGQNVRALR